MKFRQEGNGRLAAENAKPDKGSREYEIRALERSEFGRWDAFVRRSPQGTLFHTTLWLEASGVPFRLFGCFRGAEMHGGCAVGVLGHRVAGRPYPSLTPYLGVVCPCSDGKYVTEISNNKEIVSAFAAFLKSEFDQVVDLAFSPEVIDLQPFIWQGFATELRYTYRLSLANLQTAFDNMDAGRRRNLVSAERQGLKVVSGVDFGEIVRLSEKSFQRQSIASMHGAAVNRFETALRRAGRCLGFLARTKEGEPLGGIWIAWDEKRAYYLLGGYDHSAKSNNAVALAMWRAIQFTATDLKLPEFDFEGSAIPAVERFFRKFGGTLTPYHGIHYRRPSGVRRAARNIAVTILGERATRALARIVRE
jgi:Acetyltransferase (GNAT) domain